MAGRDEGAGVEEKEKGEGRKDSRQGAKIAKKNSEIFRSGLGVPGALARVLFF
jgi:hypothetical protein